ncbi:acireductone dioxygenase [Tribolium castaneum]|uniref:Acireductone dioxygenase n=1 Tax=Tribolium castaneum TaxID=7070 RepID=D6WC13_TRICA|nr:PREDICTED: 1,2-dihydroxy-3-keto-5-methylthiopentene dioxygenase isoform X2 [Tribolium castaneum]EEZ99138.2 1,2-dihydroxy-3-keto-5-methylthiopentene dioxygenase-like Protein [Tribolium castaneum]|eukprot:XP_970211.2 PREDICTED: 1,2-dihydroxy-3-keto-5-methylthiopentene dioxygenase isoform X2 [Tribolium castaneum]
MVRAWYIEGDGLDNPRDEHQRLPPKFITLEDLYRITGVEHYALNVDTCETDGSLEKLKEEKGYTYEDIFETPAEGDLVEFYKEHLHEDEESRFVLEGCGYYDIRDNNDEWIRVEVVSGDLIVVPSGCYHRFMLDHTNYFKAKRLFFKDPHYQAVERPADNLSCRQEYLKKLHNGKFEES